MRVRAGARNVPSSGPVDAEGHEGGEEELPEEDQEEHHEVERRVRPECLEIDRSINQLIK